MLARCALELARRFERGATLWCLAPDWNDHARHMAVEFVHPVIVGTRSLPARALSGPDGAGLLLSSSRPSDVLVVLESEPSALTTDVLARARVWGLVTIWMGTGSPPAPDRVDHSLRIDDPFGLYGRPVVLTYHLLWELTHVCLEHPGLLADEGGSGQSCPTCSDEGRSGEVVFCRGDQAVIRSASGTEVIDISLVQPVRPGSTVLVHAGVAISRLAAGGAS